MSASFSPGPCGPSSDEDQVDAFKQGALFAVIQGTINARKSWTKGGLVGEGGHGSVLDLV